MASKNANFTNDQFWSTVGIGKFVKFANLSGKRIRSDHFKVLSPHLVQSCIISVLLFFKLLDEDKYPKKVSKSDVREIHGLAPIITAKGKEQSHTYDASVDNLYQDLVDIFPENWNLSYGILILPHRAPQKVKEALCYIADLCDFMQRVTPNMEKIVKETCESYRKCKRVEIEIGELEDELYNVVNHRAEIRMEIQDIQVVTAEITAETEELREYIKNRACSSKDLVPEENLAEATEKIEMLTARKEVLQKKIESHLEYEELNKKLEDAQVKLQLLQTESTIAFAESECDGIDEANRAFEETKAKVLEFVKSDKTQKAVNKLKKRNAKDRSLNHSHSRDVSSTSSTQQIHKLKKDEGHSQNNSAGCSSKSKIYKN